uniref:Guanine nucleotide exchange factor rei n=1 Tax=Caenorhabditis japonica TaxID=281687 RepID=A0A8R1HKU5_CAEJA
MEEAGDPQMMSIRRQLENLNDATDDINSYEMKLEHVKKQFCETQLIFNREISGIPNKLAKHISKARPFFDLKSREPNLRRFAQQAAALFERQKTVVEMAREQLTILHSSLNNNDEMDAEKKYIDVIEQQLELVNEAEAECAEAERAHAARVRDLLQLETTLRRLLQENGPSIKKARPYYDRKEVLTKTMNSQIELMSILENEVQDRKDSYSTSMRALEQISEQIHQERSSQNSLAQAVSDTSSDVESDGLG